MKFLALTSLAGAGLIVVSATLPASPLDKQAAVLKDAKSLKIVYSLRVAGVKSDFTLTYSKPNRLIIDNAERTVESDGNTFWEYNKTAKTYTETPATSEMLAKRAQGDDVLAWASFFTDDFLKGASDVKTGGPRAIKGQPTTEVNFTFGTTNPKAVTAYIDDKQGVARGFSIKGNNVDILAMADKIEIGSEAIGADKFVFAAPDGVSKQVAPAPDATSGWASVQPVFQSNCTPCHAGMRGRGGFSVMSYASVMKGSNSGPLINPGDPDGSRIIQLVTGQAQPKMPQGKDMSQADLDKLKAWIKAGAKE